MPKVADQDTRATRPSRAANADTRAVMVLANEARRMRESAERVDLVVRAMALRRGIHCDPSRTTFEDSGFEPG